VVAETLPEHSPRRPLGGYDYSALPVIRKRAHQHRRARLRRPFDDTSETDVERATGIRAVRL
jgi:hypothetical protein